MTQQSYSLAEVRNGTGWSKGVRFVVLSSQTSGVVQALSDLLDAMPTPYSRKATIAWDAARAELEKYRGGIAQ